MSDKLWMTRKLVPALDHHDGDFQFLVEMAEVTLGHYCWE
jgi:hypothetical protein